MVVVEVDDDTWGISVGPTINTIEATLAGATRNGRHPFEPQNDGVFQGARERLRRIALYLKDNYQANIQCATATHSMQDCWAELIGWLQINQPFDMYLWPYMRYGASKRLKREAEDPIAAAVLPAVPSILDPAFPL